MKQSGFKVDKPSRPPRLLTDVEVIEEVMSRASTRCLYQPRDLIVAVVLTLGAFAIWIIGLAINEPWISWPALAVLVMSVTAAMYVAYSMIRKVTK